MCVCVCIFIHMCTDVHVYVRCNGVCLSFVCVQQRPELQLLLSVAGEEDMHVHVRMCICSTYIRDCGSNLYVGMGVVDSTIGKGERTS